MTNVNGETYKYEGSLFCDLKIGNEYLSSLLREYLQMPDLFGFDGRARLPIEKEADEYIFVNVRFDSSDKVYCYLCDIDTVMEGDEVLVPVGDKGVTKETFVESVEVLTQKEAPYPVKRCKKVIKIIL